MIVFFYIQRQSIEIFNDECYCDILCGMRLNKSIVSLNERIVIIKIFQYVITDESLKKDVVAG